MKRYWVEATAPEVWFSRRIQIIQELDIDNIVIVIMRCYITRKSFVLVHVKGTFRVRMGGLVVSTLWHHIT